MAEMIGPGLGALASIGSYVDNAGRVVRFPASSGNSSFYLPCQTYFGNLGDAAKLIACQGLAQSAQSLFKLHVLTGGRR
jgi:hypothetical protein